MSDLELPSIQRTVVQLFRSSAISLDPATADLMLRRVLPITLYVDGDYDDLTAVAESLRDDIVAMLADHGYRLVGSWGPITGSFLTTIFGLGDKHESGRTFSEKIRALRGHTVWLHKKIPPAAIQGIRVILVVGTMVVHLAGVGAVASALPFTIPLIAIEYIANAVSIGESVEEVQHLLELPPFLPSKGGRFDL